MNKVAVKMRKKFKACVTGNMSVEDMKHYTKMFFKIYGNKAEIHLFHDMTLTGIVRRNNA